MNIVLIPARAGSKGIPNKNLKLLFGIPLVSWSIKVSTMANTVDEIFVSTDSEEIADLSMSAGANVLHRDALSASDESPMSHVLGEFLDRAPDFRRLCLLEPTSPLRYPAEIDATLARSEEFPTNVIATVHSAQCHPELLFEMGENHKLVSNWSSTRHTRRQDRLPAFQLNGLAYAADRRLLRKSLELLDHSLHGVITDSQRGISIDSFEDWRAVEAWLGANPDFPTYDSEGRD